MLVLPDTPPAIEIAQLQPAPSTPGAAPAPSAAPDPTQTPTSQPPAATAPVTRATVLQPQDVHLLGNWFGLRTALTKAGITPTLAYVNQGLANVRGGTDERFDIAGQFTAGLLFNLPKLTGGSVPGTVQATIVRRHGDSFNANSGLNLQVNPLSIQGRGETWRWSQLWYKVDVGRLNVKLGRMYLNEDFDQARCDFVNGYFCLGDNTRAFSNEWPTSPVSQWAVRLQYAVTPTLTLKTAAYQYNPKNLDMVRNFYVGFKGATGVILPTEVVWAPKLHDRLPGSYTLGFYYSNADQNDPVLNTRGQIRSLAGGTALVRHATWTGYFTGRQQLVPARKDGSGSLAVFLNATVTSREATTNDNIIVGGVNYTGILPGRPKDEVGLAFGSAHVNTRVADAARFIDDNDLGDVPVRTREYVLEGYYAINVLPGLVFQPDAQWIIDPRGDSGERNAVLLGFKTSVIL